MNRQVFHFHQVLCNEELWESATLISIIVLAQDHRDDTVVKGVASALLKDNVVTLTTIGQLNCHFHFAQILITAINSYLGENNLSANSLNLLLEVEIEASLAVSRIFQLFFQRRQDGLFVVLIILTYPAAPVLYSISVFIVAMNWSYREVIEVEWNNLASLSLLR